MVQSINYWASVETAAFLGNYDPSIWSALTYCKWMSNIDSTGPIVRGLSKALPNDEKLSYQLIFFDANNRVVFEISGKGVVFRNRNFEAWRDDAKRGLSATHKVPALDYAPAAETGVYDRRCTSFLSRLTPVTGSTNQDRTAQGLITAQNGFPPTCPYLSGSGDHVNATHIVEIGRQYLALLHEQPNLICTGGEIEFRRFVELGHGFQVRPISETPTDNHSSLGIYQADELCTRLSLVVS